MKDVNKSFLQILDIELDDLKADIKCMIDDCSQRNREGIQSQRVLMENEAVFSNELLGIDNFRELIHQTDPTSFYSLDEMIDALRTRFSAYIKNGDIVPATGIYLDRKLNKVARYVTQGVL